MRVEYELTPRHALLYRQNQNHLPQAEPSVVLGRDARRIIEAKQALRKAQVSMAPSRSMTTPYVSKSNGTTWYEDYEVSSHQRHPELVRFDEQAPPREWSMRRPQTEIRIPPSTRPFFKRMVPIKGRG